MAEFEIKHVSLFKNKKVHEDFESPRVAMEFAEEQAKAWYSLMGGNHAKVGNDWDPWNAPGMDWYYWNKMKKLETLTEDI